MPLTDVQSQLLVANQVGDVDPTTGDPVRPTTTGATGIVMSNIGLLWEKYSDVAARSTKLRDLYVRRDAIDMVIGVLELQVDIAQDQGQLELRLSQRVGARVKQRDGVQKEIERVEAKLIASGGIRIGEISKKVPVPPPDIDQPPGSESFRPDADNPQYNGGSPYYRDRWRAV